MAPEAQLNDIMIARNCLMHIFKPDFKKTSISANNELLMASNHKSYHF